MNSLLRIESLSINNFATIKNQFIEFTDGLNVIVGETGSGKSLLLDAIQLTFGARADKKLIRKGSSFSTVEVCFKVERTGLTKLKSYCDEIGLPMDDHIHIKRVIYKEGTSKAFLNHQSCPISKLTNFTSKFIDLVGQFENQKLLTPSYQLKLLDSFAGLQGQFSEYSEVYTTFKKLTHDLDTLQDKFLNRERDIDYLEFQISQFNNLDPSEKEEQRLIALKDLLLASEKSNKLSSEFNYILYEDLDGGIISKLSSFSKKLSQSNVPSLQKISQNIKSIELSLAEVESLVSIQTTDSNNANESIENIVDTLDQYQKLKRKFGLQTFELNDKHLSLASDLQALQDIELRLKDLEDKITNIKELCLNAASQLHEKRAMASKVLSADLTKSIQKLNMDGASIEFICNQSTTLNTSGITQLKLTAETNTGEGHYNLNDIASGGELSRILLSLRHLMTNQDSISVFLFDEIDTGIGGKTAIKIGNMLHEISSKSQVIAITHLPQIAHFSDNLIAVEKETHNSRTETRVNCYESERKDLYIKEMNQLS